MAASIELYIVENTVENVNGVPVGKLTLRTRNPVDVPDASWFVVRRESGVDTLVCVASVADFTNFGLAPPADSNPQRHWRTNEIIYYTDNPEHLAEMIENTKRRIQAAIDAFNLIDNNTTGVSIVFD